MRIFKVCQGLELQHVRRRSGAMRLLNTTGLRDIARSMFFFESTRFHVVRRRFRRSFRRRKTEESHHMWLTQLHNFHLCETRKRRSAKIDRRRKRGKRRKRGALPPKCRKSFLRSTTQEWMCETCEEWYWLNQIGITPRDENQEASSSIPRYDCTCCSISFEHVFN